MKYENLDVLTSHDQLGDKGLKTGFWLEEGAAPYCYPDGHGPMWDLAEDPLSIASLPDRIPRHRSLQPRLF